MSYPRHLVHFLSRRRHVEWPQPPLTCVEVGFDGADLSVCAADERLQHGTLVSAGAVHSLVQTFGQVLLHWRAVQQLQHQVLVVSRRVPFHLARQVLSRAGGYRGYRGYRGISGGASVRDRPAAMNADLSARVQFPFSLVGQLTQPTLIRLTGFYYLH